VRENFTRKSGEKKLRAFNVERESEKSSKSEGKKSSNAAPSADFSFSFFLPLELLAREKN
jgi:hypothetical protein